MVKLYEFLKRKPNTTLFHYTSQSGLLGIAENKCLWATNIHYLNDYTEFLHALELAKYEIIYQQKRVTSNNETTFLESLNDKLESIRHLHVFIFSFSEIEDQLSQWRGYCNEGNGYSIGFEYSTLEIPLQRQGFYLVPCIYNIQEQISIIKEIIAFTLERYRSSIKESTQNEKDMISDFLISLVRIAPVFKHHSFYEEKEWRLISQPMSIDHPQVFYRQGRSTIIPSFNFKLIENDEQLSSLTVIVGPNPHTETLLSLTPVTTMLSSKNINKCAVKPSRIPYRERL